MSEHKLGKKLTTFACVLMIAGSLCSAATQNLYKFETDDAAAGQHPGDVLDSGVSSLNLGTSLASPSNALPQLNNPTYITNVSTSNPMAMYFDGDWDVLEGLRPSQTSNLLANNRTWDCWFKASGSQPGGRGVLFEERRSGTQSGDYSGAMIYAENGTLTGYLAGKGGGALYLATGTTAIVDGKWHHIALIWLSGGGVSLYLDGTLEASDNTANPAESLGVFSGADIYVTLGSTNYWTGTSHTYTNLFYGDIDEIRISDEALVNGGCDARQNPEIVPSLLPCNQIQDDQKNKVDINKDCRVDWMDLTVFIEHWLNCIAPSGCL